MTVGPTFAGMMRLARITILPALMLLALFAGCSRSQFETAQILGRVAMVNASGTPQLWMMTKQEEQRRVGTRRTSTRTKTYFHFELQAFDPVAVKPLWKQRIRTFGDPETIGLRSSVVIGSDVDGRLLGQDGDLVWLLIGEEPYALRTADGSIAVNAEVLQQINPELNGLLPSEAKYYSFDRGLVIMAADARQFVVRGDEHKVEQYTPPPRVEPEGPLKSNGTRELVPLLPYGDVPARHVTLRGQRLGLYSPKEAADAANDEWGRKLRWPYVVVNEGKLARRTFMNATIDTVQRFDDRFARISQYTPIANAPSFLNGRFAKDPATGDARVLDSPDGVLVWHSTRIDDAGHVALARLDANLATVWQAELPLSESTTTRPLTTWWLPAHLVVMGTQQVEQGGVASHVPYLVSIHLADGRIQAVRLTE